MSLLLLLSGSSSSAPNKAARFTGFAGADYAAIPTYTLPGQAGTLLVRCKLDTATPASSETGLVELGAVLSGSHYPYINGQAYIAVFREEVAGRVDGLALSDSVDRTAWHWFIVRTNVEDGWEFLQGADNGTLYSISTQTHSNFALTQVGGLIGANSQASYLGGDIDRMLLFDSRLNDASIQAIIAGGNGTSPIVRYEFSSDDGDVFADSSGNNRHATISGSPTIVAA